MKLLVLLMQSTVYAERLGNHKSSFSWFNFEGFYDLFVRPLLGSEQRQSPGHDNKYGPYHMKMATRF